MSDAEVDVLEFPVERCTPGQEFDEPGIVLPMSKSNDGLRLDEVESRLDALANQNRDFADELRVERSNNAKLIDCFDEVSRQLRQLRQVQAELNLLRQGVLDAGEATGDPAILQSIKNAIAEATLKAAASVAPRPSARL